MRSFEELETQALSLFERKAFSALRNLLIQSNPADVAILLQQTFLDQITYVFRLLPKEFAADVFVEMDIEAQEALIFGFTDGEIQYIMQDLNVDDAADLIDEMPANVVKKLLRQVSPEKRAVINKILAYPEDSAGSIMTTEFVDIRAYMSVSDTIENIRKQGSNKETFNVCYVIDNQRHLLGTVSLRELILSESTQLIQEIMETNIISVETLEDRENVAQKCSKYDLSVIPVVDKENRLVGIVTIDDVIDVIQQEATEDIEKMAAITPSTRPYLKTPTLSIFLKRIPWLLILMVSATFTGKIIASFENALSACIVLTAFIPMLMDTGGNSGSQASVTIIRALSLGEMKMGDIFIVLFKEFRVALLCGVSLALVNFGKLLLIDHVNTKVALVVCLTLFITVIIAKIVGCSLPILAKRLGFDPAVMASPFITTIVDALSLLVYFSIATKILGFSL